MFARIVTSTRAPIEEEVNFRKINELLAFLIQTKMNAEIKIGKYTIRRGELVEALVFSKGNSHD